MSSCCGWRRLCSFAAERSVASVSGCGKGLLIIARVYVNFLASMFRGSAACCFLLWCHLRGFVYGQPAFPEVGASALTRASSCSVWQGISEIVNSVRTVRRLETNTLCCRLASSDE